MTASMSVLLVSTQSDVKVTFLRMSNYCKTCKRRQYRHDGKLEGSNTINNGSTLFNRLIRSSAEWGTPHRCVHKVRDYFQSIVDLGMRWRRRGGSRKSDRFVIDEDIHLSSSASITEAGIFEARLGDQLFRVPNDQGTL